jgi:hypothetical protein
MVIRNWECQTPRGVNLNVLVPPAAVAQMCDRTYYDAWDADMSRVLHTP